MVLVGRLGLTGVAGVVGAAYVAVSVVRNLVADR